MFVVYPICFRKTNDTMQTSPPHQNPKLKLRKAIPAIDLKIHASIMIQNKNNYSFLTFRALLYNQRIMCFTNSLGATEKRFWPHSGKWSWSLLRSELLKIFPWNAPRKASSCHRKEAREEENVRKFSSKILFIKWVSLGFKLSP